MFFPAGLKKMYGSLEREKIREVTGKESFREASKHLQPAFVEMKTSQRFAEEKEKQLKVLLKELAACTGSHNLSTYRRLKRKVQDLETEIDKAQKCVKTRNFMERVHALTSHKSNSIQSNKKREAIARNILHGDKGIPVTYEVNKCDFCDELLLYKHEESRMLCPKCHRTQKDCQLATDHVDADYVAQDTHANHTRMTATQGVFHQDTNGESSYEKYLYQFSEDVEPIPDEVIEIILQELSQVHMSHCSKVQPTPITKILKKHNLQDYAHMPQRIANELKRKKNEPIPVFSKELIDRMLRRERILRSHLLKKNPRSYKKLIKHKSLTKVFLRMENEANLAELLDNHKTRAVLRQENTKLMEACRELSKTDKTFNWTFNRDI